MKQVCSFVKAFKAPYYRFWGQIGKAGKYFNCKRVKGV